MSQLRIWSLDMNRLDGKIAFLSGAARGIGAETARLMVEAGARVAIGDVLDERGRETVRALEASGGEALYVHLDVTRSGDWAAAIAAVTARFGGLDILVNNAGIFIAKGIEESTAADWERLCGVNLTGVFFGTQAALPALRERGAASPHGSAIVNLSSIAGLIGSAMAPLYSLTKGGVTLFTKSTALECARKGYRIRVNSIHPGIIDTEMGAQAIAARGQIRGENDIAAARAQAGAAHPIGRLGTAADVAKGILFLASDDAGFMTGSSLVLDGGWTAQ
jgi:NAD(P)-dependent dehydrogenase (short-subunit alcohol dehydrogenase family)